jgi:L-cysteate sulfo-lyase
MGGNKVRKLEFALAAAVVAGADCVVCGGVVQSNTSRQVAAACAKLGLECHLGVMHGRVPMSVDSAYNVSGNILLDRLYGAVIHDIPWNADRNHQLHRIRDELTAAGRHPYLVPYGASNDVGAIGYARMLLELLDQCAGAGVSPSHIVLASGSGGTQAGIVAAIAALRHPMRCIGIDIDCEPQRVREDVLRLGRQVVTRLSAQENWRDDLVEVADGFAGPMYGVPDEATLEAIRLAARCEGLTLDP